MFITIGNSFTTSPFEEICKFSINFSVCPGLELSTISCMDFSKRMLTFYCNLQLVITAQSGDLFAQLGVEIRVVDQDDNPIQIIDDRLHFRIHENEQPGMLKC